MKRWLWLGLLLISCIPDMYSRLWKVTATSSEFVCAGNADAFEDPSTGYNVATFPILCTASDIRILSLGEVVIKEKSLGLNIPGVDTIICDNWTEDKIVAEIRCSTTKWDIVLVAVGGSSGPHLVNP